MEGNFMSVNFSSMRFGRGFILFNFPKKLKLVKNLNTNARKTDTHPYIGHHYLPQFCRKFTLQPSAQIFNKGKKKIGDFVRSLVLETGSE